MITVYFRSEVVEASQTFDADEVKTMYPWGRIEDSFLTLTKDGKEVAQFNAGTWIYWYKEVDDE